MARASKGLAGAGHAHQKHALGDAPAQAGELLGIAQKLDDLDQLFLGSSMPATSSKVTLLPPGSPMRRARLLPKLMALPPPICIWRMKKIHTPINRSMGNQETSTVMYQGGVIRRFGGDAHALGAQGTDQIRVIRRVGAEFEAVAWWNR